MPKKKKAEPSTAAQRRKILADANKNGLTADQVAKKYGISKWTFYSWKHKAGKPITRKAVAISVTKAAALDPNMLRSEIRAVLPGILREELARALGIMTKKGR